MYHTRNNIYFCLAVTLLASCAGWLEAKSRSGALRLIKKPLPIRKPLIDMDRTVFAPFEVITAERLPPDVVENLGTQEYLNCVIKPPSRGQAGPRSMQLSVTYYTGVQDQVPHVPEECQLAGGWTPDTDETLTLHLSGFGKDVDFRRVSFRSPQHVGLQRFVYYTICVNGSLCPDRNKARFHMANPRDSHLYYSKVELSLDGAGDVNLTELDRSAAEVMDRTLTELRKSHWPPQGSERGGSPTPTDAPARS